VCFAVHGYVFVALRVPKLLMQPMYHVSLISTCALQEFFNEIYIFLCRLVGRK
jgi:hypothetical protein